MFENGSDNEVGESDTFTFFNLSRGDSCVDYLTLS